MTARRRGVSGAARLPLAAWYASASARPRCGACASVPRQMAQPEALARAGSSPGPALLGSKSVPGRGWEALAGARLLLLAALLGSSWAPGCACAREGVMTTSVCAWLGALRNTSDLQASVQARHN